MSMKEKLTKEFIINLSKQKQEPSWMLEFRLNAFEEFQKQKNPNFGPMLDIDFDDILYYKSTENQVHDDWKQINEKTRNVFCNLGVIDAEQKYLDGVSNQYESEVIYHHQNTKQDIIFMSTDEALKKHPELFQKYFNSLVKYNENKYTALNGAVWSGGTFIYIPPHTKLDRPLQSYFRIDTESLGQFERTIIIVDENSELSYIVDNHGTMEWIDGNIGSKVTMKYPSCILKGDYSVGNSISIAYAKENQFLDAGAKMIHLGNHTKSNIVSKSIASQGGIANYRGTTKISKSALSSVASIKCDTILLDNISKSDTIPKNIVENKSSILEHEASVSKVSIEKLFYLQTKGLTENEAKELLIMGFLEDFKKELPMEYAVELNRLIKE